MNVKQAWVVPRIDGGGFKERTRLPHSADPKCPASTCKIKEAMAAAKGLARSSLACCNAATQVSGVTEAVDSGTGISPADDRRGSREAAVGIIDPRFIDL